MFVHVSATCALGVGMIVGSLFSCILSSLTRARMHMDMISVCPHSYGKVESMQILAFANNENLPKFLDGPFWPIQIVGEDDSLQIFSTCNGKNLCSLLLAHCFVHFCTMRE